MKKVPGSPAGGPGSFYEASANVSDVCACMLDPIWFGAGDFCGMLGKKSALEPTSGLSDGPVLRIRAPQAADSFAATQFYEAARQRETGEWGGPFVF